MYLSCGCQITLLGRQITLLFWRPPDNPSSGRQITLLFWRPRYNSSSGRQITLLFWRLPYNSSLLVAARLRQINYIQLYFICVTYSPAETLNKCSNFEESMKLCRNVEYDHLYYFSYSAIRNLIGHAIYFKLKNVKLKTLIRMTL